MNAYAFRARASANWRSLHHRTHPSRFHVVLFASGAPRRRGGRVEDDRGENVSCPGGVIVGPWNLSWFHLLPRTAGASRSAPARRCMNRRRWRAVMDFHGSGRAATPIASRPVGRGSRDARARTLRRGPPERRRSAARSHGLEAVGLDAWTVEALATPGLVSDRNAGSPRHESNALGQKMQSNRRASVSFNRFPLAELLRVGTNAFALSKRFAGGIARIYRKNRRRRCLKGIAPTLEKRISCRNPAEELRTGAAADGAERRAPEQGCDLRRQRRGEIQ